MTQYIDKDALVAEIERLRKIQPTDEFQPKEQNKIDWLAGKEFAIMTLQLFLNTLEVKEMDLEKEIQRQYEVHKNPDNNIVKNCVVMIKDGFEYFAKHFFELGLKAQKGEEV